VGRSQSSLTAQFGKHNFYVNCHSLAAMKFLKQLAIAIGLLPMVLMPLVSAGDSGASPISEKGGELFAQNCASCHGEDGRGAKGIPDLTNGVWQYGGSPQHIAQSIIVGRSGLMPGFGIPLGEEGLDQVVSYVLNLSVPSEAGHQELAAGREQFEVYCVSCHGLAGTGTQTIGAPDLSDEFWIHGSDKADIRDVIQNGRSAEMPAHAANLDEESVIELTVYLLELEQRSFVTFSGTQGGTDTPPGGPAQ
jgi:cytochrome c oxidase cbb3-type subunit 3